MIRDETNNILIQIENLNSNMNFLNKRLSSVECVIKEDSLQEEFYKSEQLSFIRLLTIQEQDKRIEALIAENKYLKRKQQAKMGCHL